MKFWHFFEEKINHIRRNFNIDPHTEDMENTNINYSELRIAEKEQIREINLVTPNKSRTRPHTTMSHKEVWGFTAYINPTAHQYFSVHWIFSRNPTRC